MGYEDKSKYVMSDGPDVYELEEKETQAARWGRQAQTGPGPAWRELVGNTPTLRPGDHQGALAFLKRLIHIKDEGRWTKNERRSLYRLIEKWRIRAQGLSPYFELHGSAASWPDMNHNNVSPERREELEIKGQVTKIKEIARGAATGTGPRKIRGYRGMSPAERERYELDKLTKAEEHIDGDGKLIGLN